MKVLHVNAFDMNNGAARAAFRLHNALLFKGVDSKMLVQIKGSNDPNILSDQSFVANVINRFRWRVSALPKLFYPKKTNRPFSTSWLPASGLVTKINALKPDIVHLHWIGGGMMKIQELSGIDSPVVWTLHDNGPFTGGCHIMWDCKKYLKECGACPVLGSEKKIDLSTNIFRIKLDTYKKISSLTIVGVSSWISACALTSMLLRDKKIVTIPNLIDTTIYKAKDINLARKRFGLPLDKKLILFGALSAIKDTNKGYHYLIEAIRMLNRDDVELVVFGNSNTDVTINLDFKINFLGYLESDESLNFAYSAANVMIVPSIQESFGQTAMEAMSCGTPVVCFDTTGLRDIIDHKQNGYLAECFNERDLTRGIDWVLDYDSPKKLSDLARQKIVAKFDTNVVSEQFVELYKSILNPTKIGN
jgi:glycosyltransferase involved in cell wall biosynthesis